MTLNIPITIKDFEAFRKHFEIPRTQKVFKVNENSNRVTSEEVVLTSDVSYLKYAQWRIVAFSATPNHALIEAMGYSVLLHTPFELLNMPQSPPVNT